MLEQIWSSEVLHLISSHLPLSWFLNTISSTSIYQPLASIETLLESDHQTITKGNRSQSSTMRTTIHRELHPWQRSDNNSPISHLAYSSWLHWSTDPLNLTSSLSWQPCLSRVNDELRERAGSNSQTSRLGRSKARRQGSSTVWFETVDMRQPTRDGNDNLEKERYRFYACDCHICGGG